MRAIAPGFPASGPAPALTTASESARPSPRLAAGVERIVRAVGEPARVVIGDRAGQALRAQLALARRQLQDLLAKQVGSLLVERGTRLLCQQVGVVDRLAE